MTQSEDDARPLLNSTVLDRLRAELDQDEGIWKIFVQDFVAHLPARIEKLRLALTTGDPVGAMDAVLSLKTSSQMVGAERLAGLALDMERLLRVDHHDDGPAVVLPRLAAVHLTELRRCTQQTTFLLQRHL
ncbi:HPt (Histidine-containing phosphotransfer) domain-containing protein [Arthrobacter sp. 9AX]|uniref:Hpt domain-containing protein n=1 Tax=Arthrobacter sp. 9AX TaxID=2653131 RepID=UPI0012F2571C|nr:Hpt domain-containing protein [Arthrobacter sp. 9AX]VXB76918.1 HPt (Histidine-containing phosphotransfer) domain-containing protein [Arthrobacter sp. 9AX]